MSDVRDWLLLPDDHYEVQFLDDLPFWWGIVAEDDRYLILTRASYFGGKKNIAYTIVDYGRGVRGPCNLIGQGWNFDWTTMKENAEELLLALQDGEVEVSYRNNVSVRVATSK